MRCVNNFINFSDDDHIGCLSDRIHVRLKTKFIAFSSYEVKEQENYEENRFPQKPNCKTYHIAFNKSTLRYNPITRNFYFITTYISETILIINDIIFCHLKYIFNLWNLYWFKVVGKRLKILPVNCRSTEKRIHYIIHSWLILLNYKTAILLLSRNY